MNKPEDRRWTLISKEINKSITDEEKVELVALQEEVWKTAKFYNYRKLKPSELVVDDR